MKVIYVAGPFRAASAWRIEKNIRKAETLALEVWRMGHAAICPHANTQFFQDELPDGTYLRGDLEIMARCDAVLLTPDWMMSDGARKERQVAARIGIPVCYSLDELRQWLELP